MVIVLATAQLGIIDWAVIGTYGVAMLLAGLYFSRRSGTVEQYNLGGRRMNPLFVGISLFATLLSAISYLALPEEMIEHGPMVFSAIAWYPLIVLTVGWLLIPKIMQYRVETAYEILDVTLGQSARLTGSLLFLALRLIWMAFIVYLLATHIVTPTLDLGPDATFWVSMAVGLVTVAYTSAGGFRAVVATDFVQFLVLLSGAVLAIAVIHSQTGGGAGWWPGEWVSTWDSPCFFYNPDEPTARTFFWTGLSVFCWYVCTAGSDQIAIQRYLATPDARSARRAFVVSMCADAAVAVLLALLGLALVSWPGLAPAISEEHPSGGNPLLEFVVAGLPGGVSGLIIAALLAAAMSSLSSGINSTSVVITQDLVEPFTGQARTEKQRVRRLRTCSIAIGVLVVLISLAIGSVDRDANLLERVYKTVNLLVAPLFVLFLLGMFFKPATELGAISGTVVAIFVAGLIAGEAIPVSVFWLMPLSLVSGTLFGMVASLLPVAGNRRNPNEP